MIEAKEEYDQVKVLSVCVEFVALSTGSIDLVITYQTTLARWAISYDLKIRNNKAEIQMFGKVQQESLEDWTLVALSLSSAKLWGAYNSQMKVYFVCCRKENATDIAHTNFGIPR